MQLNPTEIRLRLRQNGYDPLPVINKAPVLKAWETKLGLTEDEIAFWATSFPEALSTGVLTKFLPTIDVDVLDPAAAEAAEEIIREEHEESGDIIVRFGQAPKRCVFFRTSAPFSKITRNLVAPNGKPEQIEILCDGQQVVVDGIHPGTRKPYACHKVPLGEIPHDDLPYIDEERAKELIDKIAERLIAEFGYRRGQEHPKARRRDGQGSGGATDWSGYLGNLHDHDTLVAFAMALVRSGMADGAAVNFLRSQVANLEGIDPGQRQRRLKEIPGMVASARAKLDAEVKPPDPPPSPPTKLDALVKVFEKWLLLDDPGPIYVMLGAIVANYLPGPPVWLGLIAPPSSAKTEILNATLRLPKVELMTTASPAALLSGTPAPQFAKGAKGGLLRKIGPFGILVLKDFTSVLGLHRDNLSEMLDAFREIYDCRWVRHLGSDGGKTLEWEGKIGLIFACTEAYDSQYAVIGALGDRFLLYRLPEGQDDAFERAMQHTGDRFKAMQDELANAVTSLFAGLGDPLPTPRPLTDDESLRIKKSVILACRLRAGVHRDRYNRELEAVFGAEGPGRLGLALERLLAGLDVIGVERETALKIVEKVALDSVPPIRRKAYEALVGSPKKTREVATALDLPTTTVRRALEDIAAHGLATRQRAKTDEGKDGRDDIWTRIEITVTAAPKREPETEKEEA